MREGLSWITTAIVPLVTIPASLHIVRHKKNQCEISPRRIPPIHHQITSRHPSRGIAQKIDAGVGEIVQVAKT